MSDSYGRCQTFLVCNKLEHLINVMLYYATLGIFYDCNAAYIYSSFPLLQFSLTLCFLSRGFHAVSTTNTTGCDCLKNHQTCSKSHHLVASYAQNICFQHECKHIDAVAMPPTARVSFNKPGFILVENSYITSQSKLYYLILTFRSHHEIFIRRSLYSVLPSLDATISCRIKKVVVGVTQLIPARARILIHSLMTFLADMYTASLIHLLGRSCSLSMTGEWFLETGCTLTSGKSSTQFSNIFHIHHPNWKSTRLCFFCHIWYWQCPCIFFCDSSQLCHVWDLLWILMQDVSKVQTN